MRIWITIIALLSINTYLSLLAGQPNRLPHILRELEIGRNKKVEKAQEQALEILINNQQVPLQQLNCALDILLFNDHMNMRFPRLQARKDYIDDAISLFHAIPNFQPLLVQVICESCQLLPTTNRWYEMTAALSIENDQSRETVIAFGKPTDYDTRLAKCLLHNVITNKRWINVKRSIGIRWTQANKNTMCITNYCGSRLLLRCIINYKTSRYLMNCFVSTLSQQNGMNGSQNIPSHIM